MKLVSTRRRAALHKLKEEGSEMWGPVPPNFLDTTGFILWLNSEDLSPSRQGLFVALHCEFILTFTHIGV